MDIISRIYSYFIQALVCKGKVEAMNIIIDCKEAGYSGVKKVTILNPNLLIYANLNSLLKC
jgi:hypothetical protein